MSLEWFIKAGHTMLRTFSTIIDIFQMEIIVDGRILGEAWELAFPTASPFPAEIFYFSVFELMFGTMILLYFAYVIVSFVIDLLP